jgi:raffinose/stachyose/melibiose transport system substrate-binding protein
MRRYPSSVKLTGLLMMALVLSSCAVFTQLQDLAMVRFQSNYGYQIPDQLVRRGSFIEEPFQSDPGFDFVGWFLTPYVEEAYRWNFTENAVENSITLYGLWNPVEFYITFVTNTNSEIETLAFTLDQGLSLPVPERFGYAFLGWYEDPDFRVVFNPANVQAGDYILYARWSQYPSVEFLFQTETLISEFSIFANQFANETGKEIYANVVNCGYICQNLDILEEKLNSDNAPVLFQLPFDGTNTLALMNRFSPYMLDLTNQSWVTLTDVALWHQQRVYGFPLSMRANGLVYNKNIIQSYNFLFGGSNPIFPENWVNFETLTQSLIELHSKREQLGLDAVVGLPYNHSIYDLFNVYLSSGKSAKDYSVLNDLLLGRHPAFRVEEYVNWLNLLKDFSQTTNLFGNQTNQVLNAFLAGQTALMPYTPNLDVALKNIFTNQNLGIIPIGQFSSENRNLIFHGNNSWIFINRFAEEDKINYLKDLMQRYTIDPSMRNYFLDTLGTLHPFRTSMIYSNNQMNQSAVPYYIDRKTSPYLADQLLYDYKMNDLSTLHNQWFVGIISRSQFVTQLKQWIESYP